MFLPVRIGTRFRVPGRRSVAMTDNRAAFPNSVLIYRPAVIAALRREPEGYLDVEVTEPSIASQAQAGQFVMLRVASGLDPILPRPFDIADADPGRGTFRLIIKVVGRGTRLLEAMRPGDSLDLAGPLGAPVTDFKCRSLALLVRGCGAAAVLLFLKEARRQKIETHTVLSASTAGKFILRRELEELSSTLTLVTDDGSAGEKNLGSAVLRRLVHKVPVDRVYSCGGGPFYLPDLRELDAGGRAPVLLFLESYMACGFGHCHGCAVSLRQGGYALVCRDGPLFELREIEDLCPIYQ
jgi:dihydroorotate dehydrogenase electron transfer subunit